MAEKLVGSMFIYPWDILDEGSEVVLDLLQERGAIQGVNVAMSYHSGFFLLPHNPKRKLYFADPAIYFPPDPTRYSDLKIKPIVSPVAPPDFLPSLREETQRRGMRLATWAVCLHSTALGTRYPECTTMNAFGDHHRFRLCPANPDVRAYLKALVGDLANRGVDSIILESVEYMPTSHLYHHERRGIETTPYVDFLLALCFCPDCQRAASKEGIDSEGLRRFVVSNLERFFAGDYQAGEPGAGWDEILSFANGEMAAVHHYRRKVVTSLCEEMRGAVPDESGVTLEATDFGPLWKLGAHDGAWETGFDVIGIADLFDALYPTPYFTSVEQVRTKMAEYHHMVPHGTDVKACLRVMWPDITGSGDLLTKVEACDLSRVKELAFYNYGFMPLRNLDWIRDVLAAVSRN